MGRPFLPGSPGHLLYNFLLAGSVVLALPFWIPWVVFSRKRRSNFLDRMGLRGNPPSNPGGGRRTVWMHAVSVGETNASVPLLRRLREKLPGARLLLSNVTLTGRGTAEKPLSGIADGRFYFPFDFPGVCGRFLDRVRPDVVVIVETEIWPNFLAACARRGVPVVIVNGRLSERSFRGYSRFRWFFAPVLRTLRAISAQTRDDADRFVALGADPATVTVGGNLKFDVSPPETGVTSLSGLLLGEKASGARWIVAGSTHEGEEAVVVRAFLATRREFAEVRLLLAPRHPERFSEVESLLSQQGVPTVRRTAIPEGKTRLDGSVLLLDTVGELPCAYSGADLAFVGGSLVPKGGHNVLEPAWHGVPTIVGPHMDNFREIADVFLGAGALLRVSGEEELAEAFARFAASPETFLEMGRRGRELLESFRGASERNADTVLSAMGGTGAQE
ncbi:MAG: Three-deoxy-D-manno-octulosonic-acid transferase domain protein [Deltaproteobacteria bacterium]|nr:Three-deoxy-D-manno-octulosonic-acid transferase domain protein [Deltaproteobacteria bacterium]